MVSTLCRQSVWHNSDRASSDCGYLLTLASLPTDDTSTDISDATLLEDAQSGSWSATGKLLFARNGTLTDDSIPAGIWENDMSQSPSIPQFVHGWLTASGSALDVRSSPDSAPTWTPDGQHYATYRKAQGVHYAESDDGTPGGLKSNYMILLHQSGEPTATRMLLYVDQGRLFGRLTWSPDGRYLLYTILTDDGQDIDIWWLDVNSGLTGKLTNDGLSFAVAWRPTLHGQAPSPQTSPTPAGQSTPARQLYMPFIQGQNDTSASPTESPSGSGTTPTPTLIGQQVSFPTLTPTPTRTPRPTPINPTPVPPRGISGQVLYQGQGVSGLNLQLEVCSSGAGCQIQASTLTDGAGHYAFSTVPDVTTSLPYRVTFRNGAAGANPDDTRYLLYWQHRAINDYHFAQRVDGGTFDIANVQLTAPAAGETVNVPYTFRWQTRAIEGEEYQWFIDTFQDPSGLCDQLFPDDNSSYELRSLRCDITLSLPTGEPVEWHVEVVSADGGRGHSQVGTVLFDEQ